MKPLHFQIIQTGTTAYEEMANLRMAVLLDPIGIPRSYINPEKEKQDILVGVYENEWLVGCCILTAVEETTVQLRQMAVAASHQQKGLGRQLLAFAESIAANRGYRIVTLHARDTVIPFYLKCNYTITGEPFVEVGIGHRVMQKNLPVAKTA